METAAVRLLRQVLAALIQQAPDRISDPQWRRLLQVLFPVVVQARRGSLTEAAAAMVREAELHDGAPIGDIPSLYYDMHALDVALTRVLREPLAQGHDRPLVEVASQAAVERHVQQAARDATRVVVETSEGPGSPVGWARRLTGAENCGFCVMLASRGAVYKSASSAGRQDLNRFHDGCDCEIVPVYDVNDWPGLDGFIEANRRYRRALDLVDGRGDNVLKALRRDLYADPFEIPAKAA
ncbi:hypothetical protein [Cumulibacter soli]|uniref:VG15 protein n=1 Tax=Cumulibacter soli TaxID=2546344 RepID=UPI0010688E21|nr:hypothetical protein [Cumulibacter soli]